MVSSKAKTVPEYLKSLPEDRRAAISKVRQVVLKNLPKGYVETMNWGMISYEIPLKRYPDTYNKQPLGVAALASQKNYMTLYLMAVYADPKTARWFHEQYRASGKKLDMGKSCVHFKKLADLPLDVIGATIARYSVDKYIERYEAARKKS
jgi:hypothetical protein